MVVGLLTLDVFFPESSSLKSKRSILKPLTERLRREWNVSLAETDHQSTWQRALLAVASVNTSAGEVRHTLDDIVRHVEEVRGVEVLDYSIEIL